MESKALKQRYQWHAPEGYWYTQRTLEIEQNRQFTKDVCGKTANAINNWVLWTDEQKAEWEELWLTEPEGESK